MHDQEILLIKGFELQEKIKSTNNGYLFAPTPEDVYIATLLPNNFVINYAPLAQNFPIRIANKYSINNLTTIMQEQLNSFIERLRVRLNGYRQNIGLTYFDEYKVWAEETPKYFKVYSTELPLGQNQNIVAFIDKQSGDIFKPASYKVPAKTSRGNLLSGQGGMEAIAPNGHVRYLK